MRLKNFIISKHITFMIDGQNLVEMMRIINLSEEEFRACLAVRVF